MHDAEVVVLGAGISGALTACLLADAGVRVLVVEPDRPMGATSRWNDGKIHLGYTFTGVASLATADLLMRGAATFLGTLRRVTGTDLPSDAVGDPVVYLVDRATLVPVDDLWRRAQQVAARLGQVLPRARGLQGYVRTAQEREPMGGRLIERLPADRAMELTRQDGVVAAWRVTEVHVATSVVAKQVIAALVGREVPFVRGRACRVRPTQGGWAVDTDHQGTLTARVVVNATWQERPALEHDLDPSPAPVSIRYKVGLFGQGTTTFRDVLPSTRILGAFGDIAAHANGDAYLSWYRAALLGRSDDGRAPAIAAADHGAVTRAILDGLRLPASVLEEPGATWRLEGGFIVAHGHGDIDDLASPLHERARPAVRELRPGYLSVDTGKYTLGPLMARRAAVMARRHLAARPRTPAGR